MNRPCVFDLEGYPVLMNETEVYFSVSRHKKVKDRKINSKDIHMRCYIQRNSQFLGHLSDLTVEGNGQLKNSFGTM